MTIKNFCLDRYYTFRRSLKALFCNKSGSIPILFIGVVFVLISLVFIILEAGALLERYDRVESSLRQACNISVVNNMLDTYRADGILKLDTNGAKQDVSNYISDNLTSPQYTITNCTVSCVDTPPSLEIKGNIVLSLLFNQYSFDNITIPFNVKSTNYRTVG